MVAYSAKLICKGPSIYKVKAKNLRKKERKKKKCCKSLHLQVYNTVYKIKYIKQPFTDMT